MTRIYVFPGQGSQKAGMGADLFDAFPDETAAADEALGYSIRALCLEEPAGRLNDTAYTQPALYTVCALTYLNRLREGEAAPDYLAGHSLGEYAALFAAGAFDFITGLKLVHKRGALMSAATGGGMAAVIGLDGARTRDVLDNGGWGSIDVANLNSPTQTVISGLKDEVDQVGTLLQEAGARMVVALKVSGAFHSRYMQQAREAFADYLDTVAFSTPSIPVISNVYARPYAADELRHNLANQITHPVRWTETIQYLLAQPEPEFTEVGPGNVLTGLIRQIRTAS